ncbi:uncharacterized protein LOC126829421 [Patella vulgata]|uniref:uncharacterized protein LOC126829421 n=1 Tax=Patella vulgata TaxID=6465 RepID=UPI00217FB8AB|nr:uncharacterized protein LOC126829421 [Patella vulgata]
MDGKRILLLALIYTAVIQDIKAAKLTITPSPNLQTGATSLTLRCSADANSNYTELSAIGINKVTKGSSSLVAFTTLDSTGSFIRGNGITAPKYEINVALRPQLTNNAIQVIIHNPDCHDTSEYICETTGDTDTPPYVSQSTDYKNVTVQSNPGTVEMKIYPAKMKYDVGEKIEITCQTGVENSESIWTWEAMPPTDSTRELMQIEEFPSEHIFSPAVMTENARTTEVDPQTSTQCGYNTGSTLEHHVGMEDDGLKIRCMVNNSELLSAIKTIHLTLDDVKKRMLLADTERIKLEQEKLKQQISKNTTSCNCCCN